jgi:aryl-alcohol dehydrogenase-like predicted oxidoreductase
MMFGPWGNDDRADAIRVIHRALDAGINGLPVDQDLDQGLRI